MAESSETLKQLPWNIMVPIGSVWSRWNLNNDPETKLKRCGLILAKRRNALFLSLPPKLWQENSIVLEKNGNSYEGVVRKQKLGPWISGRALLGRRRFPWPLWARVRPEPGLDWTISGLCFRNAVVRVSFVGPHGYTGWLWAILYSPAHYYYYSLGSLPILFLLFFPFLARLKCGKLCRVHFRLGRVTSFWKGPSLSRERERHHPLKQNFESSKLMTISVDLPCTFFSLFSLVFCTSNCLICKLLPPFTEVQILSIA